MSKRPKNAQRRRASLGVGRALGPLASALTAVAERKKVLERRLQPSPDESRELEVLRGFERQLVADFSWRKIDQFVRVETERRIRDAVSELARVLSMQTVRVRKGATLEEEAAAFAQFVAWSRTEGALDDLSDAVGMLVELLPNGLPDGRQAKLKAYRPHAWVGIRVVEAVAERSVFDALTGPGGEAGQGPHSAATDVVGQVLRISRSSQNNAIKAARHKVQS